MSVIRDFNLAMAFLLELAMLAAVSYWGFHTGSALAPKLALGVGVPLCIAVVWGVFLAPKARIPLSPALHQVLSALLFALASAALVAAGRRALGGVLFGLFLVNRLLSLAR